MATGVFGLRKIYKKQVENVENNNFASWPEIFDGGTIGYFGGGYVSAPAPIQLFNNLTRLQFDNDTVSESTSSLPTKLLLGGECSNARYGYFVGGLTENPAPPPSYLRVNTITRLDFSNETVSNPGNNLPTILSSFGSVSSTNYGYFGGGYNGISPTIGGTYEIKKFDFSIETATSLPASLFANPGTTGRGKLAGVSSRSYGYFGGGITPNNGDTFTNVTRLDYSTESSASLGNILPQSGAKDFGATDSHDAGYFGGGYNPSFVNTITRLDFTTENVSVPGNNLPFVGSRISALSNKSYGYFAGAFVPNGGSPPVPTARSTIVRLDFFTESINVSGSRNLPVNKFNLISTTDRGIKRINQVKTYGYFIGGVTGFNNFSTISRLEFSTETVSNPGKNLPVARSALGAISNNYYGYSGGGQNPGSPVLISTITRLDFSNETVSDPGNNLPSARNSLTATSSNSYGYFNGPSTSVITRFDFSNETANDPGKNLPSALYNPSAVSSSSYGYFGGGANPLTSFFSTIRRLDFSNETVSDPGKNLPSGRRATTTVSNSSYGYFGGGIITGPAFISTVTRLDFSTETVSNPGNNLPTRHSSAGTSSNFYGYFGGGAGYTGPPPVINTISRLDFSNETLSNPGNNLPAERTLLAAVSNSN